MLTLSTALQCVSSVFRYYLLPCLLGDRWERNHLPAVVVASNLASTCEGERRTAAPSERESEGGGGEEGEGVVQCPTPTSDVADGREGGSVRDSTGTESDAGALRNDSTGPLRSPIAAPAAAAGVPTAVNQRDESGSPLLVQRDGSRRGGRQQGTRRQSLSFADVAHCPRHLLPSAEWRAYVREAFTNLRDVSEEGWCGMGCWVRWGASECRFQYGPSLRC